MRANDLKEIESEEIRQTISHRADEISTLIKRIDPENLQKILDFYIFGFQDEELSGEAIRESEQIIRGKEGVVPPETDSEEQKQSLLLEEVSRRDFDAYKFQVGVFVLISQIMFYSIYQKNGNQQANLKRILPSLSIAHSLADFREDFLQIQEINFKPIFSLDLLAEMIGVQDPNYIDQCFHALKTLADFLGSINHTLIIKYDILGKLYHSLIPEGLRKTLAAYYTKYIIARFILEFVISDDNIGPVMDPTCGSGTFLISAYQKISELRPSLDHGTILKNVFGNDLTSFASLLATINLAFQDIEQASNRCLISHSDIFELKNRAYTIDDYVKMKVTDTVSIEKGVEKIEGYQLPKIQSIVGNPPFTKGDRLPQNYKAKLRGYFETVGKSEYINRNMPLHGYILLDLDRYLKKGGNFGLILPLTTLYIDLLEKVRLYILENYWIEYIITSEVEPFSEDTDQKEVIIIATLVGDEAKSKEPNKYHKKDFLGNLITANPSDFETKFVSLKRELTKDNFQTIASRIRENTTDDENEFFRVNHVKKSELVGNRNWSLCFNAKQKIALFDLLTGNPNIGTVKSIENKEIKAFRGFRQLITEHWIVPNHEWKIGTIGETSIEIIKRADATSKITLQAGYFLPALSSSRDYELPIIPTVFAYIIKNDGRDIIQDLGLKRYIETVKVKVDDEDFKAFLKQIINIGKRFNYSGRIAFPHRFDLETGRILCYLAPQLVGLGQNWHTIRGLSPDFENLLVAWFNSSLFLLSLLISRRQQRGPFGQTAVGEFKSYLIPHPSAIPEGEQKKIFGLFQNLNSSPLLHQTIKEQLEITLKEDNERRALDIAFMDALGILSQDKAGQKQKLDELYAMIAKEIEIMKLQRKKK